MREGLGESENKLQHAVVHLQTKVKQNEETTLSTAAY